MTTQHHKSDIDIAIRPDGFHGGFDDLVNADFHIALTSGKPRLYGASICVSRKAGVISASSVGADGFRRPATATIDDGSLRVRADNPGFRPGALWYELRLDLPDAAHPDGVRREWVTAPAGVTLTEVGGSVTLSSADVALAIPAAVVTAYDIARKAGFGGSQEEYLAILADPKGEPGYTPRKGVDYWTQEEAAEYAKTTEANTWSAEQSFGNITVAGNIYQAGKNYVTHATEVRTENDVITLREGAEWGLAVGQHAGLVARKYDGETDGVLVFGADGVARVGDAGDAQPLATREEIIADGAMFVWDADNYRLKSFAPRIVEMEVTYEDDTTETFNVICQPNAAEE